MKMFDIALFFIILTTFGGTFGTILAPAGFIEYNTFDKPTTLEIEAMETSIEDVTTPSSTISEQDPLTNALGWGYTIIQSAFSKLLDPLKPYLLFPGHMIGMLIPGLPNEIGLGISTIILLIEIVGLVQLLTGRYFKDAT